MKEDELTNSIISTINDRSNTEKAIDRQGNTVKGEINYEIIPECHYNYYGDRGVADLFVRRISKVLGNKDIEDRVYEIKSNPSNANKIIRQFNKMCNYFYRGTERNKPDIFIYELCFISSPSNFEHVIDNKEMYSSLALENEEVMITFRHPDGKFPVRPFSREDFYKSKMFFKVVENHGHSQYLFGSKSLDYFLSKEGVTLDE